MSDLSQQLPKSDEWRDFISNHNNKFQLTNLISDYLLQKASVSKDIYVTKGQFFYSKKLQSNITSVEALFSNHKGADQKIPNHVLFGISPESKMYVVLDDSNIYILMYICDALHDLVPFGQFKKRGKHPLRSVNFNKVAS